MTRDQRVNEFPKKKENAKNILSFGVKLLMAFSDHETRSKTINYSTRTSEKLLDLS